MKPYGKPEYLRLLTSSPTSSHPKQSPSLKARKAGKARCAVPAGASPVLASGISQPPAKDTKARAGRLCSRPPGDVPTNHRREFRTWRASLPTQLERETMLVPQWIAENVVQEVDRFLNAHLPDNFAARLAARAHHLYPRHEHFHKGLNRPGNRGRENLLMFMRH